jgi:P-type E1-E2 ATPase
MFCCVLLQNAKNATCVFCQRRKRDRDFNNRLVWVIRRNEKKQVKSGDIRVGDIVFLQDGDGVPADIVLLKSSESTGVSFLEVGFLFMFSLL